MAAEVLLKLQLSLLYDLFFIWNHISTDQTLCKCLTKHKLSIFIKYYQLSFSANITGMLFLLSELI